MTGLSSIVSCLVMNIADPFIRAVEAVKTSDALFITAGAGMGVDSGLPDFRGNEGFWKAYPVVARLGLSFAQMANPTWFHQTPDLAWAFYGHRLNLYRTTVPHDGFKQLLQLASQKPGGYFVFTSNVDGQFQKAGFDPERIVECHGSIHHFQCTARCSESIWDASHEIVNVDMETFRALEPLPVCPRCHELARPNVLMFGDAHWLSQRTDSQETLFGQWLDSLKKSSARITVIELGAGTAIPTVRETSEQILLHPNTNLIRINPREPAVPTGQIGLPLGALEGIQNISQRVIIH
ncbi:MAG: sIR2 [Pedosphaera sp.]|nr:sIR2 [Pedosphaera sp.]